MDKDVRRIIEDEKFQLLGTEVSTYTMSDLRKLGVDNMRQVVDYINDNVNVSRFVA
jgi:type I restriction enzyme R subunit